MRHPALCSLLLSLLFAPAARAYDEDTHFYGTYAMARHAGIRHEAASKIALSAQWMDESFISDPTSMIFLPVTGIKKRRLLHFPSSRIGGGGSAGAQRQIFGLDDLGEFTQAIVGRVAKLAGYDGDLQAINFFTETREDHPFASEMLMEGLREGNLMKAAAGLHTLEDSFAHAGTPAEQGHALFWHWPDRPYASVEKYGRMTRTLMSALVAIRTLLPRAMLDCSRLVGNTPACAADARQLADSYLPMVLPVISRDMMRDPEYVKVALREFHQRATEMKYLEIPAAEFERRLGLLQLAEGKTTAYMALAELLGQLLTEQRNGGPELLRLRVVLQDMGRLRSSSAMSVLDYIDSYGRDHAPELHDGALENFSRVMASELLAWHVPSDLNDSHRMELEDDHDEVRKFEVESRVGAMRDFIRRNFGTEVQFVGSNTNSERGFYRELRLDPSAEPDFSAKPGFIPRAGTHYATFSLSEKHAFDRMIFAFLFPTLQPGNLDTLIESGAKIKRLLAERSEYYAERKKIEDAHPRWSQWIRKKIQLLQLDLRYKRYRALSLGVPKAVEIVLTEIRPLAKPFLHDIFTTRLAPAEDVLIYRRQQKLQEYIAQARLKPLLGDNDAWKLQELLQPPPAGGTAITGRMP